MRSFLVRLACILSVGSCFAAADSSVASTPSALSGGGGVAGIVLEAVYEEPKSTILKADYIKALRLTPQMNKTLLKYNARFRVWDLKDYSAEELKYYPYSGHSLPYAVKGDFNGDGTADMALSGHDDDANIIIVLLSSGTEYTAVEAQRFDYYKMARKEKAILPYKPADILVAKRKGSKCVEGERYLKTHYLKNDGFAAKEIMQVNAYRRPYAFTAIPPDLAFYEMSSPYKFTSYIQLCDENKTKLCF